jgi:hypothetical protein
MQPLKDKIMIGRKTQIVAQTFFGDGPKSFVHFMTPSRIPAITRACFEELREAGMVTVDVNEDSTVLVTATDKIGTPRNDYEPLAEGEDFVMILEKGNEA